MFETTKANIQQRSNGVLISGLPKSFQDAVNITRELGYGLIWIDRICIIQDDEQDWERESADMASIYMNAVLTLSATRSHSSDKECFFEVKDVPYYGDEHPCGAHLS